jgi:hypothetical protein
VEQKIMTYLVDVVDVDGADHGVLAAGHKWR